MFWLQMILNNACHLIDKHVKPNLLLSLDSKIEDTNADIDIYPKKGKTMCLK